MLGTMSMGVRLPIIRDTDDIEQIVVDNIINSSDESNIPIEDGDIIGITESIVARANGLYVDIEDVAESVRKKFNNSEKVYVLWPIYSRNRFSLILKGIAKAVKDVVVVLNNGKDEVGNELVNQFTGVDIVEFYTNLIKDAGARPFILKNGVKELTHQFANDLSNGKKLNIIHAECHPKEIGLKNSENTKEITLAELCDDVNPDFGLLGSNKASENELKLFPTVELAKRVCLNVQRMIKEETGKHVEVLVYGDGCFKDPVGGIWEFADPVSAPYYTDGLEGTPNELKFKYIVDNDDVDETTLKEKIKSKQQIISDNKMQAQGTTPRMYRDLVASLCDLTSGSGDKGTPVIWIKNYFKNYAD